MRKTYLLILLFPFILSSILCAQSFKVIPSSLQFNFEPNQSSSQEIELINTSDIIESFVISTSDFSTDDKGATLLNTGGHSDRSCEKWISVSPSFVTLNPNERKKINVILNVPSNVSKTTWAMILIRTEKEFTGQAADVGMVRAGLIITPQIGVKVVHTPPHLKFKSLSLDHFREIPELQTDSTKIYKVILENSGDVLARGKVYLTLSNLETLDEKTYEPVKVSLLPVMKKDVILILPGEIPPGFYSLAAILDYGEEYALEGVEMDLEIKSGE